MLEIELDLSGDETERIEQLTGALLAIVDRCFTSSQVDPEDLALALFSAATTKLVDTFDEATAAYHHQMMATYCRQLSERAKAPATAGRSVRPLH